PIYLPAGSPAINRGVALSQVLDDIDGQARPVQYDIGADEFGGEVGGGDPPPPQPPGRRIRDRDPSQVPRNEVSGPSPRVREMPAPGERDNGHGPGLRPRPTGANGTATTPAAADIRITPPV